jgi:hypothetical protein
MALVSIRELFLHRGARGFRLSLQVDPELDRKLYDAGVELESARAQTGTVANIVFEKLSSFQRPSSVAIDTRPKSLS